MEIIKAIIPAAGLGTRFLPYTKTIPKEMLPIGTRPAIQLVIEEALAAEIHNIMIITSRGKHLIQDYFDTAPYLEELLKERRLEEILAGVNKIGRTAHFTSIRQSEPMGLGHAVLMARHLIGKEYCAVMLPDDIIIAPQPTIGAMATIARQEGASIIAVCEMPSDQVSAYGVIGIKHQISEHLFQVSHLVEKPHPNDAPSNLAVVGRYILSHEIFPALETVGTYATNELQLTDAISCMIQNNEKVLAYKIPGTRHDVGTHLGWLKANIAESLNNPLQADHLTQWLATHAPPYQTVTSSPLDLLTNNK